MPFELLAQYLKLPVFALVAARLAGLLMFQPALGAVAIPMRLRALLVMGLAAIMTPLVNLPAGAPATPLEITLALGTELLLGGLIGLMGVAAFLGLQWGAQLVAQEAGLAFGQIVNPNSEEQETVLGVFYVQIAVVVYLIIGGHRALVSACLDTFDTIPLLSSTAATDFGSEMLLKALTIGAHVALRIAAPAMLALFLVNVLLGFISRTMPQLNVLAVGFSVKALTAFLLMAVALPSAVEAFVGSVEHIYTWIHQFVQGA